MEPDEANPVVLAIDPGSAKCGIAVVSRSGIVLFRGIVTTESLLDQVSPLIIQYQPERLIVGSGTGSKPLLRVLSAADLALPIQSVDESYTSEAARARYVAENPPRGLEWLLPRSLRTPPLPYDDYVAVILAERFWQAREEGRG